DLVASSIVASNLELIRVFLIGLIFDDDLPRWEADVGSRNHVAETVEDVELRNRLGKPMIAKDLQHADLHVTMRWLGVRIPAFHCLRHRADTGQSSPPQARERREHRVVRDQALAARGL